MECSPYIDGEKSLIYAIINQAFHDAISLDSGVQRDGAFRFIKGQTDEDRWLFNFYVTLLGYDPDWIRERLVKRILAIRLTKTKRKPKKGIIK